jgi:hypothetical protein
VPAVLAEHFRFTGTSLSLKSAIDALMLGFGWHIGRRGEFIGLGRKQEPIPPILNCSALGNSRRVDRRAV